MEIKSIGIVGAGQMGNGIAHVMALAGYDVLLNDISQDSLDAALERMGKNMDRQVSRDLISAEEKENALKRVKPTLDLPELGQTDLIIEAAAEREDIKDKIFATLVPHLQAHTILTSNTSSISITRLATAQTFPKNLWDSIS